MLVATLPRQGRRHLRCFSSAPPSDHRKESKQLPPSKPPLQRLKDFFTFAPGSPWYGNDAKTFRHPAPGSEHLPHGSAKEPPHVHVPSVENTDTIFNTQYYTRDTRRNKPPVIVLAPSAQTALPKMSTPEPNSPGRFNVNVMKYDPTGSRSAMTTNRKAVEGQLVKFLPDHLPAPAWRRNASLYETMVADAARKNIPVPAGIPPKFTWQDRELDGKW